MPEMRQELRMVLRRLLIAFADASNPMISTQQYVADMCESINVMKITYMQKDFVRAAFRAAIDYANAKNHMHASPEAKAVALSRPHSSPEAK